MSSDTLSLQLDYRFIICLDDILYSMLISMLGIDELTYEARKNKSKYALTHTSIHIRSS